MRTRVKVEGDKRWIRTLASRAPRILRHRIYKAAEQGLEYLSEQAQQYPPPPPGSQYIRTYQLRRGWQQSDPRIAFGGGGGFTAYTENTVSYAPYVQDPMRMAVVHWGRWKDTEQIERESVGYIMGLFEVQIAWAESEINEEGE